MTECDHVSKVIDWGISRNDGDVIEVPTKYGCTKCEVTSEKPFPSVYVFIDHTKCGGADFCFHCKSKGLSLNTGDASSQKMMSNKKWDGELDAYRQARSEGIQPAGTTMAAVNAAREASETLGKAYDANDMPATTMINKESVSSLKEAGIV